MEENPKITICTSAVLEENFIRREKRRRLETKREIEKMRAALPVYDLNHIRQFKMPYDEALLLELEESGYHSSKEYIKQLFDLQDRLRNEAGSQSNFWNLPVLRSTEAALRKLSDALRIAENEHNNGNYRLETETMLKVAIDFSFDNSDWFWLGEQLLLQCISTANLFKTTGKHEALVRYVYAKLLIEQVKNYVDAEEQLNITRGLSSGKGWNIKKFLPGPSDSSTLFMKANYLLHLCYMRLARYWAKGDQKKALEYAIMAKKRANEACYHDGETMALLLKGQCELSLNDTRSAVNTFNKAFYIQSKLKSEKGMCEAMVELSKAYLMHGNTSLALQNLMALKEMAEEHGLQYYLAQAYRYLGEYYLNSGEPNQATPLLSEALSIFHSTGFMSEADQVRNLGALSAGLEAMPDYVKLIQQTDKRYPNWFENLMKLVKWKDLRAPFSTINLESISENLTTRSIFLPPDDVLGSFFDLTSVSFSKSIKHRDSQDRLDEEKQEEDEEETKEEIGIQKDDSFGNITEENSEVRFEEQMEVETGTHDLS